MMSRSEQLKEILARLVGGNSADISGAVVVGSDGIVMAYHMSSESNIDRVGAITATMQGVTSRVTGELKIGAAEEVIVRSSHGYLLVMPISPTIVLSLTLRQGANLGMVRLEARDAGGAVAAAMNGLAS
ncbi:MAG: dynein regulation protein LC7 [Chloroflexales bacterium]|nr:dynein regulation protein LC7 [Chloroflexales bacterium]